jgi:hypothetical protein
MGSITGLRKGAFTSIDNSGEIRLGNTLNSGTAGQALVSGGPNAPARWDIHTGIINPLTMGSNVSLLSGNPSFDGSIADTLNSVNTTYTAGNGIQISGSNIIQTKTDNQTIRDSGGGPGNQLEVIKVPNTLSAGNNLSYSTGTTYDGSVSRTIDLDSNLSNLDLSSTTNIIPGAVLATKIQRTTKLSTFSNVYSEYSSDFRTSFKAQSANIMVEFRAIVRADNRVFYGGLYDYNAGVYITDSRNRFNYNDETDQDHSVLTWWMRNLTPGTTYYISPYFRGQSASVYIYAGHSGCY